MKKEECYPAEFKGICDDVESLVQMDRGIDSDYFEALDMIEKLAFLGWSVSKPCTNISEESEDDEFQCSYCGITLTASQIIDKDPDDGDKELHSYLFKFCPNCGRRIDWSK